MKFICLLFLFSCSNFYYYPKKLYYSDPQKHYNHTYHPFSVITPDGENITGWFFPTKKKKKGLIVHFHGNAENMSTHFLSVVWLVNHGYDLITFDYRGYGKSTGDPDPLGIRMDGLAILDYGYKIFKKKHRGKFIILGQSIGGAIAMDAIAHWDKREMTNLLVLDSTFSSYSRVGSHVLQQSWITYLFSPIAYLILSTKTNPEKSLQHLTMPKLVIHGTKDPIIPFEEGELLYSKLSSPKEFHQIDKGRHIESFFINKQQYRKKFLAFLNKI